MALELQSSILYGPVPSRRFGQSLGINLSPCERKLCSFNCVYCQYGTTTRLTAEPEPGWDDLPAAELVLEVVEAALRSPLDLDVVTFSGNGEPTLHPQFPVIARGVAELVERLRPDLHTVLLSNSTTLHRPEVQDGLEAIDVPVLKLDAATPATLRAVNCPARGVRFEDIAEALVATPGVSLETLLVDGEVSNCSDRELDAYFDLVRWIAPEEVQLLTADRPTASRGVVKVPAARLRQVARVGERRTGVPFLVYTSDGPSTPGQPGTRKAGMGESSSPCR